MSVVILCFNLGFYMVRFFEIMTSIKYVIKDMMIFCLYVELLTAFALLIVREIEVLFSQ